MSTTKDMVCVYCKVLRRVELVRNITHAGISNIFWKCTICKRNASGTAKWIAHEPVINYKIDIDQLPINEDGRIEHCAVCGEIGVDNHHWLPRYLAEKVDEDAEKWPQAWLCKKHHKEWHDLLTPNMSGNQRD
jgi:hypothetical protein